MNPAARAGDLRGRLIRTGALVLIVLTIAYRDVIPSLVHAWAADDNYSHGFLIPPIAAYLAWQRRERFRTAPTGHSAIGFAAFLASLLVPAFNVFVSDSFPARLSFITALAGAVLLLFGWRRFRALAFPLAILLLMIPLPPAVHTRVEGPLQLATAHLAETMVRVVDIPVVRDGNLLMLSNIVLEVADECSGIRTLISLLTLGLVFGYVPDSRRWPRVLVTALTVPVVVAWNGTRVAATAVATHYVGPSAAQGFFHDLCGWFAFAAAFATMLMVNRLVVRIAPGPKTPASPTAVAPA